jgi:hypothetical protein
MLRSTFLLALVAALAGADPVIAEKDLVPGGQIRVELAALGESRQSVDEKRAKPTMCAMQASLPPSTACWRLTPPSAEQPLPGRRLLHGCLVS